MSAAVTEAQQFHMMRGHANEGTIVIFRDGRRLTVKEVGAGWALVDAAGRIAAGPVDYCAAALTKLVLDQDR